MAWGARIDRIVWATLLLVLLGILPPSSALGSGVTDSARASTQELLDLNTARPEELRALPGMGDAYVRRILAGRPYTAKNQLVTRGILPQEAYARIRDAVVAHRQGIR